MSCRFAYTAIKPSGERVSGFLVAEDKADLLKRLLAIDLYLLRARRHATTSRRWFASLLPDRLLPAPQQDWYLLECFSSNMVLLLRSQLSLADSLDVVMSTAERQVADIARVLLERIQAGQSLSQASRSEPAVFGRVYPSLFTLGESTGDMHTVFQDVLHSVRWHRQLKARLKSLVSYPLMVLLLMGAVFVFLLLSVVPQLSYFVQSVNQQLPWHTHALFSLSEFTRHHGWQLLLVSVGAVACVAGFMRASSRAAALIDKAVLLTPLLGPLLTSVKLARFFHCLAMLSRSRIDLLSMLNTAKPLLNNVVLEHALDKMTSQVSAGSVLALAMRDSGVFPELVWRMVHTGERSGEHTQIFQHISDLYDAEVAGKVSAVEQYLPPALISLVGLILLWMIVSILGPLYDTVISAGAVLI